MRAYKLLAAGIGTLLLGLVAATPTQAKIILNGVALNGMSLNGRFLNGLTMNGVGLTTPAQTEPLAFKVLSVTLPATKAE